MWSKKMVAAWVALTVGALMIAVPLAVTLGHRSNDNSSSEGGRSIENALEGIAGNDPTSPPVLVEATSTTAVDVAVQVSDVPSLAPSDAPSSVPSDYPSGAPSDYPSIAPSDSPSMVPSVAPTDLRNAESDYPSINPKVWTDAPSAAPSDLRSVASDYPSIHPPDWSKVTNKPTVDDATLATAEAKLHKRKVLRERQLAAVGRMAVGGRMMAVRKRK